MHRRLIATIAGLALALGIAGTALAWAPIATEKCNENGSTQFSITLHADGNGAGTYDIAGGAQGVAYQNGDVIVVNSSSAVTVTEHQGEASISQTFQPQECAQPTPTPTVKPTPKPTPKPSHKPTPTPNTTPPPTSTDAPSDGAVQFDARLIFLGAAALFAIVLSASLARRAR